MSFCTEIKKELVHQINPDSHCDIAELSAIFDICATRYENTVCIKSDNILIIERASILFNKILRKNARLTVIQKKPSISRLYCLLTTDDASVNAFMELGFFGAAGAGLQRAVNSVCCKKAYIRGAFLSSALMSNPEKAYHAEFTLPNQDVAKRLLKMLDSFNKGAKLLKREQTCSVYIKDSDAISDLLKIIGANDAVLTLEGVRVLRDINNSINRRANCDTANFDKTAAASASKVLDINLIINTCGINYLPPPLREVALLRLEHTEASLSELGELMNPPLSKSAINHRFRKISQIAARLRV